MLISKRDYKSNPNISVERENLKSGLNIAHHGMPRVEIRCRAAMKLVRT
jgi:hypothetical protein